MSRYGSDHENPNYVESVASLKRKTKEDIRLDQLVPSHILEDMVNSDGSPNIRTLLEYYYKFMNMEEFIYTSTEIYTDLLSASTVYSGRSKATFRIPDPNNENNEFFSDSTGGASTLIVDNSGTDVTIPLTGNSVPIISNGNELPGTLVNSLTPTGKTFTIEDIDGAYVGKYATLTTVAKHWVGPGPSYVLNAIEEALNIDENSEIYLDQMQKEIAGAIPRNLTSVEKRSLYKNITEFYKLKGAQDSIEIFFRLLFDENVEVEYPWDETLIPSSGDWDVNPAHPAGGQYLDHKGWLSDKIKLQDSYYYQKFSYNIKTGKNLSDWKYAFDRLVHPAGFIFFGEILVLTELTRLILGDYQRVSATTVGDGLVQDPENEGYQYVYLNVYPRSGRKTLSSMPGLQPGVIGAEDIPLLVEAFASTFLPNIIAKIDRSATLSTNFSGGQITSIDIINGGWGYATPPTLTITGDNGSNATATCTIDTTTGVVETVTIRGTVTGATITAGGSGYTSVPTVTFSAPVDGGTTATGTAVLSSQAVASITITNAGTNYSSTPTITFSGGGGSSAAATATTTIGGSGYTTAYTSALANPDVGKVKTINLSNLAEKTYADAPILVFNAPTATDADGVPLSTNVTATATIQIAATDILYTEAEEDADQLLEEGLQQGIIEGHVKYHKGEITGYTITEDGFGYIRDPRIRIVSPSESEDRGKDVKEILIIMLNHVANKEVYQTWGDGFKTLSENDYFESKNTYYANKKFRDNYPISFFSENIIGSTYESVINKYNVKTNITQE